MNILNGQIENVLVNGSLSLVYINVKNLRLSAIIIDTPATAPHIKVGNKITVVFKETEVIIGTGICNNISMQNKFLGTIKKIESKELLSKVVLDTSVGTITSIITTNAVNQLKLQVGLEVTAMIKTNEIILSE